MQAAYKKHTHLKIEKKKNVLEKTITIKKKRFFVQEFLSTLMVDSCGVIFFLFKIKFILIRDKKKKKIVQK